MKKTDIAKIFEPLKTVYPDSIIDKAVDDTIKKLKDDGSKPTTK